MKLYTEEQVKRAISLTLDSPTHSNLVLDHLTPIELPSDEEFEQSDYASERAFKDEIEWISNNPECKQIDICSNSLSKKCICPKEEQEAQQQTALEWLYKEEENLFISYREGFMSLGRYTLLKHKLFKKAKQMEKEQVDSRVKDLEGRLFNCSKDNADLMAKLQNIPTYDDVRKSIESALTEEQVLTAEEFLDSQHNIIPSTEFDIRKVMIEFAKLHVEEALKQASEKGLVEADDMAAYVDRMSILNAYPLTNIK